MKKKLITVCLLVLALTIAFSSVAANADAAKKYSETDIANFVNQKNNVENTQVALHANKCIVAIQPKEMLSKSQYKEFKTTLKAEILEKFQGIEEVFVTCNARAYKEIERLNSLSQTERQTEIQKMLERIANRPQTRPQPFDNELKPMPRKGK